MHLLYKTLYSVKVSKFGDPIYDWCGSSFLPLSDIVNVINEYNQTTYRNLMEARQIYFSAFKSSTMGMERISAYNKLTSSDMI